MYEAVLFVYGMPGPISSIYTKDAAINAAELAKRQGKIKDYRVEETTATSGKIIAQIDYGSVSIVS
jgi:hypothetical protein